MEKISQRSGNHFERLSKQSLWEKQMTLINSIEECGPIDENIKETIAALNVNGICTVASCGGHSVEDRHNGDSLYPWILISVPSEPGKRFPSGTEEDIAKEGELLQNKVNEFLDMFYLSRQTEEDVKLKTDEVRDGRFGLLNIDFSLRQREAQGELTEEEKSMIIARLPKRQKEMEEFGSFLKSSFFANE